MKTTNTTHTPGPWEAIQAHDGKLLIHRRDSGYKSLIAFTASSDSLGHGGSEEANAKLIAACPSMLEMLLEALPLVEEGEQFHKPSCRNLSKRIRELLEATQ